MESAPVRTLLKRGLHRSVYIEQALEEGRVVRALVKRFRSADRVGRLFDRRRARREARMLAALAERGIRVPRALGVRKADPGWELTTEFVAGAAPLAELFQGGARWPQPAERVARELGRAAAHALLAGLDHDDLHAANVLIDESGAPWLVDVAHARLRRTTDARLVVRDLIRWTADARESATIGFRQRFLLAFLREIPPAMHATLCAATGGRAELARHIERAGRAHRRAILARQVPRWTRESSAACALVHGDLRGWARRDLTDDARSRLLSRIERALPAVPDEPAWSWLDPEEGVGEATVAAMIRSGPRQDVAARWFHLALEEMHGIPAARVLLLLYQPRSVMVAELPAGACPLDRSGVIRLRESSTQLEAVGGLIGTLHDRCYRAAPEEIWVAAGPPARAVLVSEGSLAALTADPRELARDAEHMLRSIGATAADQRSAFLAGYLRAFRGGRAERAWLAGALDLG